MKKKFLSMFLVLAMALAILPLSALAASWTVEIGDKTITVTQEGEEGKYTYTSSEQGYTFTKAEGDNMFYYSFGEVHDGLVEGVPITEVEVNEGTVTTEATTKSDGTAEVNFSGMTDANVSSAIEGADDGVVKLEGSSINANTPSVEVHLSDKLVAAVQEDKTITSVQVNVSIATVVLPVSTLDASEPLTVSKVASAGKVLGGISLTMGDGEFDAPIEVSISVSTTASSPVVAYLNEGRYFRVRQNPVNNGTFTFFTRHFSDFVVVDSEAEGVVIDANVLEASITGSTRSYGIEYDETLVIAMKNSKGGVTYTSVGAGQNEMRDETFTATVTADPDEVTNIVVVEGGMPLNGDGTPNVDPSAAVGIDSEFADDML